MPEFYNGAIDFQPVEEEDQRPKINAACEPGCSSAWKNYLACGERIEAKVGPYCSLRPHPTSHAAIQCGTARSLLLTGTTTPSSTASCGSCCIILPSPQLASCSCAGLGRL